MTSGPPILPVGTQVVTSVDLRVRGDAIRPAGSPGIVVQAPVDATHAYRVRFPDGSEQSLRGKQLAVRKRVQSEGITDGGEAERADLFARVIYRCVIGSRAYGLEEDASDTDLRGIYLAPADSWSSLWGVPDQIERHETQECYWELRKFLVLALKANPNVLECLYSPMVQHATPLAEELLAMRSVFLSKLIYQTYNGYVMSQFKKMQHDVREHGAPKWKHAMHMIRLLLAGVTALAEGVVPVHVGEHRAKLLALRRGEIAWDDVNEWRLGLHRAFELAFAATRLPARPDYERVNDYLVRARRSAP